jgi:quinol monooxygenase YgiN
MTDQVVHVVARLVPRPGKAQALATAIQAILPQVRGEPGCLAYLAHGSLEAPGVIVMVEAWADQASLDAHASAPAFMALAGRFGELLAEPAAIERVRRIA